MSNKLRALIVGGSGALGRRIAAQLVSQKVHVTIHGGRNKQNFQETIAYLQSIKKSYVHGIWAPIGNHQRFYRTITKSLPAEILIMIYGPCIQKPISSTTYTDWHNMAIGNFVLPAACLSANMNSLQSMNYGRVIGFASDYRVKMSGYKQIAAYAAAKWALASAMQSAAKQNTNPNVKFYLIAPGYIDHETTDFSSNNTLHQYSIDDIARGVVNLLDQTVDLKSGSVIELDRMIKAK